jgi:pyrimidine operon attenuation protein/uracil phosphoribosyltransferase
MSFPLNSIKANAYAANAAIVIGIMVEGITTAKELKKDLDKSSANKISE